MGWVLLGLIAGLAALALWLLKVPRTLAAFVGAAMMLGATGYALTGSPWLRGQAPIADAGQRPFDQAYVEMRDVFFGRFGYAAQYLGASDAMLRIGESELAVKALIGGLYNSPHDPALWTALGTAYVDHDGGVMSSPARLAFEQAIRGSPLHPGPPFFYGLALVRTGDFAHARGYWLRALALTPKGSPTRQVVAVRLALLDTFLREQAAAARQTAPPRP